MLGWWWAGLALLGLALVCLVALLVIVIRWANEDELELEPVARRCTGHLQRADVFAARRDAVISGRAR